MTSAAQSRIHPNTDSLLVIRRLALVRVLSPVLLLVGVAGFLGGAGTGDDVRVSILWKALTFRDEREARVYDDHEDDLSLATIVDLLRADLAQRGHQVGEPSDPYGDSEWSQVLTNVYMLGR